MSDQLFNGIPMIDPRKNYWLIRTQGGRYYKEYRDEGFIGINWEEISIEDITTLNHTRLKTKVKNKYPEKQGPGRTASQLITFVKHIKEGDAVIITGPSSSVFSIGEVLESDAYTADLPPSVFEEGSKACPFSKRKKVRWIKELHKWEMEMKFFKLLQHAQNTISDAGEYADLIESQIHDFFIRGDHAQLSIKVKKDGKIPFHQFFGMGNELIGLAEEFNQFSQDFKIDLDNISTEVNINSPGKIKVSGVVISITLIGLIFVGIAGGKFKYNEVEFETNGIVKTVSEFLDQKQAREHKDMLIQEYMKDLEIEAPDELKSLIIEEQETPPEVKEETVISEDETKKPRKLDSKHYN